MVKKTKPGLNLKFYILGFLKQTMSSRLSMCVCVCLCVLKNKTNKPWLVWLSELGIVLQTERSPVRFPVRAHD